MRRALLVVLLFLAYTSQSQSVCSYRVINAAAIGNDPITAEEEGHLIIEKIIRMAGLPPTIKIQPANIANASAVIFDGQRYILYNPVFISQLTHTTGSYWSAVSVLAHEIGHHISGHVLDSTGSQPMQELEADEFSGFVLSRMGAPLQSAQAAMRALAKTETTATHPSRWQRLNAIARGWLAARAMNDDALLFSSLLVLHSVD